MYIIDRYFPSMSDNVNFLFCHVYRRIFFDVSKLSVAFAFDLALLTLQFKFMPISEQGN
jgi:hypothetical protein